MEPQLRVALFEPDIPQNTGAILRLAACLGVGVDIIEPCGFTFSKQRLRRSGMDYLEHVDFKLHQSWEDYYDLRVRSSGRLSCCLQQSPNWLIRLLIILTRIPCYSGERVRVFQIECIKQLMNG